MKLNKKNMEKAFNLIYNLQDVGIKINENGKVIISPKVKQYITEALTNEPTKVTYVSGETVYTLEVTGESYALTRTLFGQDIKLLLTVDELEQIEGKELTPETVKELAYYVDHVKARFGL